jgi:hypothetical protein
VLVLLPVVLVGGACGGAARIGSQASLPAAGVCRPAELKALFRGFQAVGDSIGGAVVVTDVGSRQCWLNGSPQSISLLDDGGDTVPVKQRALDLPPNGGPAMLLPGVPPPTFGARPAHGSAWLSLTWSNWCFDTSPSVRALLIVLPPGGSIAAPLDTAVPSWAVGPPAPRCADSRAGSTLRYGRFQAAGP